MDTSVVEGPLADRSGAAVLDEVLFPLATNAPAVDCFFFGLPELVNEGVNFLDG